MNADVWGAVIGVGVALVITVAAVALAYWLGGRRLAKEDRRWAEIRLAEFDRLDAEFEQKLSEVMASLHRTR